jgi:putative GTP pyrophosphokinase
LPESEEAAEQKQVAGLSSKEWGNRYRAVRGTYQSLTIRLRSLIVDLLADAKIDVIQIEARTKDIESFMEKISRKGAKYNDPLVEITDLVGLRIITYYLEDVARVGEILKREFQVDEDNSVDKAFGFDPDRFGYSSVHYVLTLSPARRRLVEWKQYGKVKIEVQVRTSLQHAWAAVSHKLDYKSSTEVPKELRRQLYRLSALFELADEQFSALRDSRERVASEYADDVRGGRLNLPLDEASLSAYIRGILKRDVLREMAIAAGAKLVKASAGDQAQVRSDLLRVLDHVGISSIADLDEYLSADVLDAPLKGTNVMSNWAFSTSEDVLLFLISIAKQIDMPFFEEVFDAETWEMFVDSKKAWDKLKNSRRAAGAGGT